MLCIIILVVQLVHHVLRPLAAALREHRARGVSLHDDRVSQPHCPRRLIIIMMMMIIYISLSLYIHIYIHIYTFIYISIYLYIYVCVCISLSLYIYIYIHTYTYIGAASPSGLFSQKPTETQKTMPACTSLADFSVSCSWLSLNSRPMTKPALFSKHETRPSFLLSTTLLRSAQVGAFDDSASC